MDKRSEVRLSTAPPLLTVDRRFLIEIIDPDEEIFALYSRLAGSSGWATSSEVGRASEGRRFAGGLGFLNSSSSVLNVELEIDLASRTHFQEVLRRVPDSRTSKKKGRSHKSQPKQKLPQVRTIAAELHQDIFAIHHRKGDTGSLVWWASVDFAELLWYDLLHPFTTAADSSSASLLDMQFFISSLRILELGSGTGSFAVLCNQMFPEQSATSWTVSDQATLLPTTSRNLSLNRLDYTTDSSLQARYQVVEMDWIEIEKDWLKAQSGSKTESGSKHELILAIDCLYHEALVLPLLRTLDHLAKPCSSLGDPATLVLIVSQLRSNDVMRLFVESWMNLPSWKIFRVDHEALGASLKLNLADSRYVVWCGWKVMK